LNPISKDEWIRYFKGLWSTKQEEEPSINATTDENLDPITVEELTEAIKYSRNKKAPGYDELMKYAPTALHYRFFDLLNTVYVGGLAISLKSGVLLL
jgi:hypothetical protein